MKLRFIPQVLKNAKVKNENKTKYEKIRKSAPRFRKWRLRWKAAEEF